MKTYSCIYKIYQKLLKSKSLLKYNVQNVIIHVKIGWKRYSRYNPVREA